MCFNNYEQENFAYLFLKNIMAVNEIFSVSPPSTGKTAETHALHNM